METNPVRLKIIGITYNQIENGMYAMVLEEEGGHLRLPIIIGYNEAQSIECLLQGITTPRPLTHAFTSEILEAFSITIDYIEIKQLPNGIFTADVYLSKDDEKHVIDARSSDAIALAMRANAPIFTSRDLMDKCGIAKESLTPAGNHIIANKSIPGRQAVERVKRPADGDFSRISDVELESLMKNAVENEDYEKAEMIKNEIDRRLSKNSK